jgi:hypothetical protein
MHICEQDIKRLKKYDCKSFEQYLQSVFDPDTLDVIPKKIYDDIKNKIIDKTEESNSDEE